MMSPQKDNLHQLTFFDPLKDGGSKQASVLQSVVDFFSLKKDAHRSTTASNVNLNESVPQLSPSIEVDHDDGSRIEKSHTFTNPSLQLRRPSTLGVETTYKNKEATHGSEVELLTFKNIFKDFPKRIVPKYHSPVKVMEYRGQSDNSSEDLKQYWMPDKHCHECYECGDRFTTFRRRHHCRICGHIFCSRCCYQFIPREVIAQAGVGMLRSCTYCYSLLTSYTKPTVTNTTAKNLQILNEYDGLIDASHESNTSLNLQLDPFNTSFSRHPKGRSRSLVSGRGSPIEDGVMSPMQTEATRKSPYNVFDVTPGLQPPFNNQHEQVTFAKGSVQLHELWAKISDDKDGLEFRDHRYRLRKFTQSVTGTELVDWLITRGITETRPQGCAIAQALLDAEWIKSVVDDRVFHDEYCLYQHGSNATRADSYYKSTGLVLQSTPIKQSRRPSRQSRVLSHEYGTTLDNEPNWVKEISNEEEKDSDDGLHFWSPVQPFYKLLDSGQDYLLSSDSSSAQSGGSLSSYVEIDNEHKIIKYKRPRRLSDSSPPPLESGLKQPKFVDENVTSISADYIRSFLAWHGTYLNNSWFVSSVGWREKEVQTSHLPSHVKHAFYRLKKLYFRHSMKFLHQLFVREKLHTSWSDVVVPLAKQICDTVTPNAEVNMEICHYVHVKKLLDNEPQDSRLLWGVVFSHNVVHNKMMNRIDNPTIMLLATPLEYQRVQYKLSSLDPIVQQEPEFLKHLISRIVSRKPDIVMSQCSVSHEGRRLLLDAGITLIINVKQPVMERLSRCTNADVAYSIDQLKTVRLGSCGRFRASQHYNGRRKVVCSDGVMEDGESSTNAYKTLIYVDGCDPTKGCSVILRDLPHYLRRQDTDHVIQDRLSRVKRVLLFLIRIMYHGKLEISYLLDQQDVASSFPSSRKKKRCRRSKPTVAPPPIKGFSSETSESEVHSAEESVVASGGFVSSVSDDNTITPDFLSANDRTPDSCPDSPLFNAAHKGATFTLPNVDKPNIEVSTELEQSKHGKVLEEKSKVFQDFLKTSLLSTSPLIQPVVPFLLTNKGPSSPLRKYLPERLFWSDSFCSNPESVKHEWVGKIRHRTQSNDRIYTDVENETVSLRSRSGTSDTFAPENMWRTPLHQRSSEDHISNYNEMILSVEVEAGSSVKQWQGVKHDRMTSHVRMPSQVSTRGLFSKDDLMEWERMIMSDILQPSSPTQHPVILGATSGPSTSGPSTFGHATSEHATSGRATSGRATSKHATSGHATSGHATSGHATSEHATSGHATSEHATSGHATSGHKEEMTWKRNKHIFLTSSLSKPASSTQMKDLLASFRARGSNLTPATRTTPSSWGHPLLPPPPSPPTPPEDLTEPTLPPLDCLEPHNHQHIFVLFSSYSLQSPNAPYPCVIPWAVDIDYYHGNDITIGGFLERYCFRPSYHCPSPTCKRPMVEHVRSFVHGNTAMNIVLKELSKPIPVPHILSWCWDPTTKTSTDIRPLSEDGWSMSFAKFLELRLQTHPTVKQDGEVPAFGAFQYFLFKDIVAAFKCYHVQVHDVALPSSKMAFNESTTWLVSGGIKVDSFYETCVLKMNELSKVGYEAMDSIQDMILDAKSSNPYDLLDVGDVGFDVGTLQQTRGNHFDELLSMYQDERCHLRDTADNIHLTLLSIKKSHLREGNEGDSPLHLNHPTMSTEESVIVMRPCEKENLSSSLLKLACLVDKLVLTWNNRISKVFQQDKNSRRGSKSVPSYPNPPLPLDAVLTSENLKPKRSPVLPSLFETTEAEPEVDVVTSKHEARRKVNYTKPVQLMHEDSADSIGSSYDDSALFSEKSPLTSSQSVPRGVESVPRGVESVPRGVESAPKSVERQSSVKRFSKTASSISMRSILTHLRTTTPINMVEPPFPPDEHYLLPDTLNLGHVVRDTEPSSIIAYSLATSLYQKYVSPNGQVMPNPVMPDPVLPDPVMPDSVMPDSVMPDSVMPDPVMPDPVMPDPVMPSPVLPDAALPDPVMPDPAMPDSVMPNLVMPDPVMPDRVMPNPVLPAPVMPNQNSPKEVLMFGNPDLEPSSPNQSTVTSTTASPIHIANISPTQAPTQPPHNPPEHLEIQFSDSTTKFYCKIYFASKFKDLREKFLDIPESTYITSLSRCVRWDARGGKSGLSFHKTLDDRLVLKQMSKFELQSFLDVAPSYLDHVSDAIRENTPTALSKILGVYRVSFRNMTTNRSFKQDLLIMENLFYKRNIQQVFDLKGSVRNRHVKTGNDPGVSTSGGTTATNNPMGGDNSFTNQNDLVLLDENLLSIMKDHPLYVHQHTKVIIKKALHHDSSFLARHLIIDYSLLVGIDDEKKEIVVGIIDYMRTFTWDKKLEMVVKSYGMIGRQGTRSMPTVVSPELYKTRFCDAMERYFQVVPDRWYGLQAYEVK
uniref:1-phosphatidylinositol 3-phosphate 5-kinase-like isoform X2 n=1 Tax=Ciona intestinalis TaxID=7719 RepID=UPI000EF5561C|nr:1-phosphatidylinositol 3-phosphate 5-kinase-like isoform X2 [Ciona intestinalis]|eukprot:XP_018669760.2 1-phosphatidylinositol 3-phosphate 5-kinase-like isoform X2 [Ciona intestinalis]